MAKQCMLHYCGRPHSSKGLCKTHRAQQLNGKPLTPIGSTLPLVRIASKRSGAAPCLVRGCERMDKVKGFCGPHYQLSRNYGVSAEEIASLVNGKASCQICGSKTKLVFDHDHACCPEPRTQSKGRTCGQCRRGVLCNNCNTALGMVRDNVEVLAKMIEYLTPPKVQLAA